MDKIIEAKDIVKRYKELIALNHFDLNICRGDIYGLLGPNGSGKTTAINCILGVLKYDRGAVKIFGKEMTPVSYDIKRKIGVVPQEVALMEELTVYENIDFFCGLYIEDRRRRKELVKEAMEFVDLGEFKKFLPKKLSGGLKRRLNIACGIAHKPELIFLDEPTVAVDTQSRNSILEGIKELNRQGATVVYTSHYMEEVEQLCRHITIMDKGRNLVTGSKEEIKDSLEIGQKIEIELLEEERRALSIIEKEAYVYSSKLKGNVMFLETLKEKNALMYILRTFEENNIQYGKVVSHEPSLNDVFLSVTGKELRDYA